MSLGSATQIFVHVFKRRVERLLFSRCHAIDCCRIVFINWMLANLADRVVAICYLFVNGLHVLNFFKELGKLIAVLVGAV